MKIIVFVLSIILISSCQSNTNDKTKPSSKQLENEIESYLKEQIKVHEIPGLAVAVVKNNEVIYKGQFGIENFEDKTPVSNLTMFSVYSISKLISATAVFQLVEQGEISLDDTISKYIEYVPEKWQNITITNLLTHSSGLPNFSLSEGVLSDEEMFSKISKESLHFEKGNQWEYNHTNYWFLSKVIEKVTATSFEDFVLKNQFSNSKKGVLFSSNSAIKIPHRVYRYDFDEKLSALKRSSFIGGRRAHSSNGLNITLDELILWNTRLDTNKLLKPETKAKMWQAFKFKNDQMTFLHGWHSYLTNNAKSYGFTGGGQTGFRKFINNDLTIIYLSNGQKYYSIHNTIIDHIAGIVDPKLVDKKNVASEKIIVGFLKMNFENAKKNYFKIRDENSELDFEDTLNNLTYEAFFTKKKIDYGIKILELNTQEHQNSANAFDSLAEGYFLNDQLELSKINYQKSLELNPENTNAKEMINRIEKRKVKI